MIITTKDLNQARKEIAKLKKENKQVVVQAQDSEFNRKMLEIKDVDILLSPHIHDRKDKLNQRDSGLNEVLCTIAKKNDIKIGIDIAAIKRLSIEEKINTLARLKQNIFLCKKTGAHIIFFPQTKDAKQDLQAFIISLSGSTKQAKDAVADK